MTTTADPHRVAVLVLPACRRAGAGIWDRDTDLRGRTTTWWSAPAGRPGPVPSDGFTVTTTAGLDAMIGADAVIVPGYHYIDAAPSVGVLDALRAAHGAGARLVSICVGAAGRKSGACSGSPSTGTPSTTGS